MFSGCCELPGTLLFPASFMLLEFTRSYHCSDLDKTESGSSDRPTKKTQFWTHAPNLFFLQGSTQKLMVFLPLVPCWAERGTIVSGCVLVETITFVLSSPHPNTLYCQHEIQTRQKPVFWAALQNVWTLDKCSSLLFPSPEWSQKLSVFSQSHCIELGKETITSEYHRVFYHFNVASFAFAWGARDSAGFWISQNKHWSRYCCLVAVSMEIRRLCDFVFCHLLTSPQHFFLILSQIYPQIIIKYYLFLFVFYCF